MAEAVSTDRAEAVATAAPVAPGAVSVAVEAPAGAPAQGPRPGKVVPRRLEARHPEKVRAPAAAAPWEITRAARAPKRLLSCSRRWPCCALVREDSDDKAGISAQRDAAPSRRDRPYDRLNESARGPHKLYVANPNQRPDEVAWSELEQAFFASAPPDEPTAAPARLDGSPHPATSPLRDRLAALRMRSRTTLVATRASLQGLTRRLLARGWVVPFTRLRLGRRGIAIAVASTIVLMGLSAVVVASRSGPAGAPVAPAASPAPAATPASAVVGTHAIAALRPHMRASKHPRTRAASAKLAHRDQRKVATRHSER